MKKIIKCKTCGKEFKVFRRNGIIVYKECNTCRAEKKRIANAKQAERNRLKRKKATKKKKKEIKAKSNLVFGKKVWRVFANYLKAKRCNFEGKGTCYTCGLVFDKKQLQAGHFKHRGRTKWKAIDFEENHIQLQCQNCNCYKSGKEYEFGKRLEKDYGEDWVREIIFRRNTEEPLTYEELVKIKEKFEIKIKEL